jgi:hypothetical protein
MSQLQSELMISPENLCYILVYPRSLQIVIKSLMLGCRHPVIASKIIYDRVGGVQRALVLSLFEYK